VTAIAFPWLVFIGNRVKRLSRIARGKITLHMEQVELARAVQAAVEASGPLIEHMGHESACSLPAEPVWIEADAVRLAQVISNLLNNAAKYTPAGGRIALAAQCSGDEVEIRVTDNGIGIPRDNSGSTFDMFTQVEGRAFHSQGGLGIGLALVKGLVALHGGSTEARSDGPGRGSEFVLRLPARRSSLAPSGSAPRDRSNRVPLRILVVDDNRDAASTLSTLASMMGHEVRVAFHGEKAVQLAGEFRPHTVLLDLGGQDEDRRKSAEAGFDSHLVKPVGPETLGDLLGDLR
jgi:CheY-like chemotaxis protein